MIKNNIKIMKTPPPLSEDEILKFKNFDKLMADHRAHGIRRRKITTATQIVVAIAVLAVVSVVWWTERSSHDEQKTGTKTLPTVLPSDSLSNSSPEIPEAQTAPQSKEGRSGTPQENSRPKNEARETRSEKAQPPVAEQKEKGAAKEEYVYVEAEPVNGFPDLYAYLNRELSYPVQVLSDSVEGVVTVSFVIDTEGKPVDIKIVNTLGPAFDAESKRLIEKMPKWKPATVNGTPVSSRLSLPLTFEIVNQKMKQ